MDVARRDMEESRSEGSTEHRTQSVDLGNLEVAAHDTVEASHKPLFSLKDNILVGKRAERRNHQCIPN